MHHVLMTAGCMDTFSIRNKAVTLEEAPTYCMAKYEWNTFRGNNAYESGRLAIDSFDGGKEVGADELFDYLCEWDAKNFIICAGTGGKPGGSGSHDVQTDGIADSHVSACAGGGAYHKPCTVFLDPSALVSLASSLCAPLPLLSAT